MSPATSNMDGLLEALAEIEHQQWLHWSQAVAREVPASTRQKWQESWGPYASLSEESKESDRKWAFKVLALLREKKLIPENYESTRPCRYSE